MNISNAPSRNRAVKFIDQIQPDVVLLGANHTAGYSDADWIGGTSDLLALAWKRDCG